MDPSQVAAYAAHFQPPPPQQPPHHHQQPPHQQPYSTFSSAYVHPPPSSAAAAVNPTNPQQPLPSHPSYTEMITAAILWENSQGKVSGSSKRAIAKYIDRVYSNLPPTHSALLTHHLKRLKSAGQLVMIKNSYQLPSFAPPPPPENNTIIDNNNNDDIDVNVNDSGGAAAEVRSDNPQVGYVGGVESSSETVKRRPGRPPKRKEPEVVEDAVVVGGGMEKRGRGRPPVKGRPQQEEVAVPFVKPVTVGVVEASNGSVGKRRGRPPKKQRAVEEAAQPVFQVEVEEQLMGPNGVPEEEGVVAVVKRRPGRPAKMEVVRGRGRPKRVEGSSVAEVVGTVSEGVLGVKKRGWPKGKPRGKKAAAAAAARNVGGGRASYGGKKRGRKPKGSMAAAAAVEAVKKVYTGKPRGRPKRNSVLVKHASDKAQGLAAEELLKKLEDMQSKVRDAVEIIRPHVADHSAPDVLSALQQLEELSTVDVTASPTSTVVPPAAVDVTAAPPSTSVPTDLTDPTTMMSFAATSGMNVPLPFSMNASMTVSAPFHAPSNTENHEPISWGGPNNVDS